jgi:hypothetical protein
MDDSNCVEVGSRQELGAESKISTRVYGMGKNERSEDGVEDVE